MTPSVMDDATLRKLAEDDLTHSTSDAAYWQEIGHERAQVVIGLLDRIVELEKSQRTPGTNEHCKNCGSMVDGRKHPSHRPDQGSCWSECYYENCPVKPRAVLGARTSQDTAEGEGE